MASEGRETTRHSDETQLAYRSEWNGCPPIVSTHRRAPARSIGRVPSVLSVVLATAVAFGLRTTTGVYSLSTKSMRVGTRESYPLHAADKRGSGIIFDVAAEHLPPGANKKNVLLNKPVIQDSSGTPRDSTTETTDQQYTNRMITSIQQQQEQKQQQLVLQDCLAKRDMYIVLGLLWTIAAISALDRVAMSVAILPMSTELDLSNTLKGSISSLFSVGYGIGILPAGLILATLSPRNVLAFGVAVWSIATVATPGSAELLAVGAVVPLFLVRALVGAGESFVLPTVQRLLAVWTQSDQKSVAFAFIFSGFQAGTIGAYLLSPSVMDAFGGWRGLFYTYGAVGLIVLVPWLLLAKDGPSVAAAASDNENKLSAAPQTSETPLKDALLSYKEAPWKQFLQSKGCWGILLAHAAKNYGLYNNLAWTPTFYSQQYGVGVKESAFLSVLPSVAGMAGGFVAGIAADSILRNMADSRTVESTTQVRKVFQAIGLLGPAVALALLALYTPEDPLVAQIALTAAVGMQSFNSAGFEAGLQDKVGPKWAGMLYSVTSLPPVLLGTFGVWFTGVVLDSTQNDWSYVFTMIASINVLGALAFLLLFDSKREFD